MSLFAFQIPLTATAPTLIALGTARTDVRVSGPAYLGGAGVTSATGFPIAPTDGVVHLSLTSGDELYAIASAGPESERATVFVQQEN